MMLKLSTARTLALSVLMVTILPGCEDLFFSEEIDEETCFHDESDVNEDMDEDVEFDTHDAECDTTTLDGLEAEIDSLLEDFVDAVLDQFQSELDAGSEDVDCEAPCDGEVSEDEESGDALQVLGILCLDDVEFVQEEDCDGPNSEDCGPSPEAIADLEEEIDLVSGLDDLDQYCDRLQDLVPVISECFPDVI